jgi:hypothetical protein
VALLSNASDTACRHARRAQSECQIHGRAFGATGFLPTTRQIVAVRHQVVLPRWRMRPESGNFPCAPSSTSRGRTRQCLGRNEPAAPAGDSRNRRRAGRTNARALNGGAGTAVASTIQDGCGRNAPASSRNSSDSGRRIVTSGAANRAAAANSRWSWKLPECDALHGCNGEREHCAMTKCCLFETLSAGNSRMENAALSIRSPISGPRDKPLQTASASSETLPKLTGWQPGCERHGPSNQAMAAPCSPPA